MQAEYPELFPVLNTQPEIEVLVNPFITAYQNDAMEQLEGQVASAKIGLARLSSPQLYWVLSVMTSRLILIIQSILKLFMWETIQKSNRFMVQYYRYISQG